MNEIAICMCIVCALVGMCIFLLAVVFHIGKGNAADLLAGFNSLPKARRAQYDKTRISRDARNQFYLWAGIFAAGALGAILHWGIAVAACVVWVVLLIRGFRLDVETAYESYRLQG